MLLEMEGRSRRRRSITALAEVKGFGRSGSVIVDALRVMVVVEVRQIKMEIARRNIDRPRWNRSDIDILLYELMVPSSTSVEAQLQGRGTDRWYGWQQQSRLQWADWSSTVGIRVSSAGQRKGRVVEKSATGDGNRGSDLLTMGCGRRLEREQGKEEEEDEGNDWRSRGQGTMTADVGQCWSGAGRRCWEWRREQR
ncbi:hypothetical protein GW17_00023286 [Ensete ventricosum]|nr:hypothetical protein GW17_00023286 [Ensete ventricosum]